jgi:ATPase
MAKKINKLIPDTSSLIKGLVSEKIKNNEIEINELIIHEAVLAELEHQANLGRAIGYLGLDEIKEIKDLSKGRFEIKFGGRRPKSSEIKYASLGEIDSLIRELAWDNDATLITSDKVQAKIAEAKDMKVIYAEIVSPKTRRIKLDSFFDKTTMSVHLKENVKPYAKKGMPGNWEFITLRKEVLTQDEIKDISKEIIESAKNRDDGFLEIQRDSSTIVQLGHYRIVITRPPFSDGWEITAVKPVKKLSLKDYKLSEKLNKRISEQAEGILIAGAPGEGKTTFASALAEYYASKEKIVKTIEAPRDLVLGYNITQYAMSHGDAKEIHDILLLSRPDYTIFDEMRNTYDFKLFSDLRLSGIGLVGVLHSTNPIDAVQRFVGRIELGVIPHVIDTVIFIKNGSVKKVLNVEMTVKVPNGMTEEDLARPVVEVKDFETGKLEFEMYSFGEETVVIPITDIKKSPAKKLAEKEIEKVLRKLSDDVKVDILSGHKAVVYVNENDIARIIGKQGKNIEGIEKKLGIHIDVKPMEKDYSQGKNLEFNYYEKKNNIVLYVDEKGVPIDVFVNGQFLFTATSSKKGELRVKKKSKIGNVILDALKKGNVELRVGE